MRSRGRVNGRHFDLMRRLIDGDVMLPDSDELSELVKWGYATRDGIFSAATDAGRSAYNTWENMEPG